MGAGSRLARQLTAGRGAQALSAGGLALAGWGTHTACTVPASREAYVSQSISVPDGLPVLSRGKHRNPRRGACFMELASFIAGERWSDHPACTHPLLAEVARTTNDRTSDAGRPLLAPLIPSVVGLITDDPRADARIALHCALTALPVAPFQRQRALAVGVHACQRQLTELGDVEALTAAARVLADVPEAAAWATAFLGRSGLDRDRSARHFRRSSAPSIVSVAARGISEAGTPAQDELLRTMLERAIEQCRALVAAPPPVTLDEARWEEAVALTR